MNIKERLGIFNEAEQQAVIDVLAAVATELETQHAEEVAALEKRIAELEERVTLIAIRVEPVTVTATPPALEKDTGVANPAEPKG